MPWWWRIADNDDKGNAGDVMCDDNGEEDDWDVFDAIPEEFSFEEVELVAEVGFDEEGEEITEIVPRLIKKKIIVVYADFHLLSWIENKYILICMFICLVLCIFIYNPSNRVFTKTF